jgi:hypothetical protein
MRAVHLACGCVTVVEFTSGERLVRCTGGGLSASEKPTVDRQQLVECAGGVAYCIKAVPSVSYEAVRL